MANEITTSYTPGSSLTANVYYDDAGTITEREADIVLTEEPASSGVYKGSPTGIVDGDIVVIYDSGSVVGSGVFSEIKLTSGGIDYVLNNNQYIRNNGRY